MKTRVLIVDDDQLILDFLAATLSASGFEVITASDGETALRIVESTPPDLVILDVGLPGISGIEVCKEIDALFSIPTIMLSGNTELTCRVTALGKGADDYVTKPFGTQELIARIHAVLRRRVHAR